MILKNSLKLTFVNSSNIWKLLLYRILCALCVLGLTTVIAWPIINILIKENFFVDLQSSFEKMLFTFNFEKLFLTIDEVFKNLWNIITNNGVVVQTVLCVIFDSILIVFLEEYSTLAINQSVYGYMSSLTKYGFTNSYVSNFGKATLLGLTKLIIILPINLGIWLGAYFMASSLYSSIGIFAVLITMFLLIVIISLKNTFFSGWVPASIIHDEKPLPALKRGFNAVSRKFIKTFASFLILTVALFTINIFVFEFTVGVGLLVTMPLSTLLVVILGEVMYFEALGMRYYVDGEHIISPKRLEEQDSFAKVKDII